jgi:hypothetical protein
LVKSHTQRASTTTESIHYAGLISDLFLSTSFNVLFGDVLRGDGKINEFDPLVVAVGRGAFADLPKCAAGLLGLAAVCRGGGAEQGGARYVEARG